MLLTFATLAPVTQRFKLHDTAWLSSWCGALFHLRTVVKALWHRLDNLEIPWTLFHFFFDQPSECMMIVGKCFFSRVTNNNQDIQLLVGNVRTTQKHVFSRTVGKLILSSSHQDVLTSLFAFQEKRRVEVEWQSWKCATC